MFIRCRNCNQITDFNNSNIETLNFCVNCGSPLEIDDRKLDIYSDLNDIQTELYIMNDYFEGIVNSMLISDDERKSLMNNLRHMITKIRYKVENIKNIANLDCINRDEKYIGV